MNAGTNIERLSAEFWQADDQFAMLGAKAAQANLDFSSRKLSASASEFAKLRDAAEQASLRRDDAKRVRDTHRAALDAVLEMQARQDRADGLAKELAAGEQKLTEMDDTIRAARAELARLMNVLPEMEKERNRLLRQLAVMRQAANAAA